MTDKIKGLEKKILRCQRKLLKACLSRDEAKIIKLQHRLLRLNLKQQKNQTSP